MFLCLSHPAFACHSVFTGVQDAQGNYIVGGHLGKHQTKPAAGTVIQYRRKIFKKKKGSRDTITIIEPTHEVLRVVVSAKLFTVSHEISMGIPFDYRLISEMTNYARYRDSLTSLLYREMSRQTLS